VLDICMLASLLPKKYIHFRCGTQCSNIQAWFCVFCTLPYFTHVFVLFKESTHSSVLVNLRVFIRESEHMGFPEEVVTTYENLEGDQYVPKDVPTF